MKKMCCFFWLVPLVVVLAGCSQASAPVTVSPLDTPTTASESPLPTSIAFEITQPRILFLSDRDGALGWYSMASDGSDVRRMGFPDSTKVKGLAWVPDLKAFSAVLSLDGQEDLYLLDAQGNVMRRLTSTTGAEGSVAYSRAAARFAFTCTDLDLDICSVSAQGGEILNLSNHPSREDAPNWSPSGEQILFVSNRSGVPDVWIIDRDGADPKNLTLTGQPHGFPRWSPDGGSILFTSQRDFNWEVYVMDADSGNPVNLTNHPSRDIDPQWSPDGEYIAFRSNRNGDEEIYVMAADGTGLINVTNLPGSDEYVFTWSPDGETILYTSEADGDVDVYVVGRDGTGAENLTNNSYGDFAPRWIYY